MSDTQLVTVVEPMPDYTGQKVRVYRNLRNHLLSVVLVATGRVIFYADMVGLDSVTFRVRQGGRWKVLTTGHKNVHAFAEGRSLV